MYSVFSFLLILISFQQNDYILLLIEDNPRVYEMKEQWLTYIKKKKTNTHTYNTPPPPPIELMG